MSAQTSKFAANQKSVSYNEGFCDSQAILKVSDKVLKNAFEIENL